MLIWKLIEISIAILLIYSSGRLIPFAFSRFELKPDKPEEVPDNLWSALIAGENKAQSAVLGMLERSIAVIATYTTGFIIVGGWLAFKVASKWQVWSNIIAIPKSIDGIDEVTFLKARRVYGSGILMRFLVGTSLNFILGFAIASVLKSVF